jgi:UDP-N-acetylmuramoyl-tripeptide--D-alanyl-D-alanine ligase
MNHTGELSKISRAISPDIAIITRIGSSHIGNFGSREMIARAKSEIASSETVRCLIVPHTEPLLKDKESRKSLVISKNENLYSDAFYRLVIKDISSNGCVGQFIDSQGEFNFNASINGQHNLECLGFAIAAARECGLSHGEIRSAIEDNSEWEVRGNNVRFGDFTVFDDSYNSSPESVIADLDMLKLRSRNKLSVALGDIYELGSFTEKIHQQLEYTVAKKGVKKMYLYGVYSQFIKEGALLCGMDSKRIFTNSDLSRPEITAEQIFLNHEKNEAILLKASHAVNMGAIIQHLKYLENKK